THPISSVMRAATWDGGGPDSFLRTPQNWTLEIAPAPNDFLFFDGFTRLGPANNFVAGTQFNGISFNSTANAFTLGGNTITLNGNVANNSSGFAQAITLSLALNATREFFVTDRGTL